MKTKTRMLAGLLAVIMALLMLAGCTAATEQEPIDEVVPLASYRLPAQAVKIDMTASDPTSSEMQFVYDDSGRITQCYYAIGGQQIYVSYMYQENSVTLYAFMNSVVAANVEIPLPAFDASVGFAEKDGYYFKGYAFPADDTAADQ
ncbi:MAG: hypothetical protein IJU16_04330 [Clostridia bacterium]|nr:hypothetical protein [Clostridia bacterium]